MKKKYRSLAPVLDVHALQEPHDFDHFFDLSPSRTILEIGFGTGEFLVSQAQQYPQDFYLGVEKNIARIFKTANKIIDAQQNNVRIVDCDAFIFLKRFIAPQSLDKVICLFPCPWPKKGQVRHRLFSHFFFTLLSSRLKDNGSALLVTDYQPYAEWVKEEMDHTLFECSLKEVSPQFDTKFERKWEATGQQIFFQFEFDKKKHVDVPVERSQSMRVFFAEHCKASSLVGQELSAHGFHIKLLEKVEDPTAKRLMILAVVSEEHLMQHCWIEIIQTAKGWRVGLARGSNVFATASVARAVEFVYELINQV